jgi:hypothetical protein
VWITLNDRESGITFWAPMEVVGGEIPWSANAKGWIRGNDEAGRQEMQKKKEEGK